MELLGRSEETLTVDGLLGAARDGVSGVLVLRGEPGIGKTAILDHAVESGIGAGFRVVRVVGIQAEQELGYAALHRLLIDLLPRREVLPPPQRDALEVAFGLASGARADRFLIGLAVLTLVGEAANDRPVLWVCDDAQWSDRETLEVLAFLGRRLEADRVVLLIGVRDGAAAADVLDDLPVLLVGGLQGRPARELVERSTAGRLDAAVAGRVVAEAHGNPLALKELSVDVTGAHPDTSRVPLSDRLPLGRQLEARFLAQTRDLPAPVPTLLLLVAAEASGEPGLLWRAADRLGIAGGTRTLSELAEPARAAGMVVLVPTVSFRHPLIRSAVYEGASPEERRRVHAALAEVIDADSDVDRRAWHRAAAIVGPDDELADDLERGAERARGRAGYNAASMFLLAAAEHTADRPRQVERLIAAALARMTAGDPNGALAVLDRMPDTAGPIVAAGTTLMRGAADLLLRRYTDGMDLMLAGARALRASGAPTAGNNALDALQCVLLVPWLEPVSWDEAVHLASLELTGEDDGSPTSPALASLATRVLRGPDAAVPEMRLALDRLRRGLDLETAHRFGPSLLAMGMELWDLEVMGELADRAAQLCHEAGALSGLRTALHGRANVATWSGDLAQAARLHGEFSELSVALGGVNRFARPLDAVLAGWRGDEETARAAITALPVPSDPRARGGLAVQIARTGVAVLENGWGRYSEALAAGRPVWEDDPPFWGHVILPELVEAGLRGGDRKLAEAALERLRARATAAGTPWALGVLTRCRALAAEDDRADELYRAAQRQLLAAGARGELARAHLLHGEWLRRRKRRGEARRELERAHEMFADMGSRGFAERARTETAAAGLTVRARMPVPTAGLTPQERRIALLAADGATNQQIATELFVSANTVEYHLRKVFRKLDISSRRQIAGALDRDA
ncbi:transcriptional regulator [Actinomycetospora sp. NBRC 106375]|uniref:ATP-binding protein n=1 Tax=Actinomycetospora sp. NBRC 106375 TaxID=3032207 RepID=UPI0024A04779|nr:LuxR family transcriptional regulator [Actinomycetospora sp. NBRC 106375]GLZ49743.1 transcriptional regulator [Actinomycetospora sp. NBRC 106375]